MRTPLALGCALALSTLSCGDDPGRVNFRLEWPSDPDAPAEVFLRGEVRVGGGGGTVTADPVGPVAFGGDARLDIGRVPNGVGHVAVLEVVESAASDVVLYFGQSPPFDLVAGRTDTVEVPVVLRRPPEVGTGTDAVALVSGARHVRAPDVLLALSTDTGVAVEISNRAGFAGAVRTFDLATADGAAEGCPPSAGADRNLTCRYQIPWNLDVGIDDPCVDRDSCPRTVYARFVDGSGFRSRTASLPLTLDTNPPRSSPPPRRRPWSTRRARSKCRSTCRKRCARGTYSSPPRCRARSSSGASPPPTSSTR